MKNINVHIFEKLHLDDNVEQQKHIPLIKVYNALYKYFDRGGFPLDAHGERTGSGKKCIKEIRSIIDILNFCAGWDEVISNFSGEIDEDTLRDIIEEKEMKLMKRLVKEL